MPSPIRVGDLVHTFNSATDNFDQEGLVSQVLSAPQAYGGTVLPAGSVAVSSLDGSQTMWISQEHIGVMLRMNKVSPSVDGLQTDSTLLDVDSPTVSTPDYGHKVACMRLSFGDALSEVLTDKATAGYANANASISSMLGAVSSFFGLGANDARAISDSKGTNEDVESEDSADSAEGARNEDQFSFSEGDVVDLWSYETLEWELGGAVTQVLSKPMTLVSMELPAGSILVSMKGTLRWFTPELCSLAVRRSELPKLPREDEDLHFLEGDEVEVLDLHSSIWQPAVVSAVATVTSSSIPAGSLTVCLRSDAQTCTIIPDMFGKLVRKPHQLTAPAKDAVDAVQDAESVDVGQWNPDAESCPKDTTQLSSRSSTKPDRETASESESSPKDGVLSASSLNIQGSGQDSSISDFVLHQDGLPFNTSPSKEDDDSQSNPQGFVNTVPSDASSDLDGESSRRASHSGRDKSNSEDLEHDKASVKCRAILGHDDSIDKVPSDGTTVSGQLTPPFSATPTAVSPSASPGSLPHPAPRHVSATSLDLDDHRERAPSPAGSAASRSAPDTVRPTVSLRIPDMDEHLKGDSRPSTPAASPRQSSRVPSTLEGPPYERNQKKVLVVGPGFGRELNPQQGQILDAAGFQVRWVYNLPNPETPQFPIASFLPVLKQAIDEFQPDLLICASKGGAYATGLWRAGLWDGPTLLINRHPTLTEMPKGMVVVLAHGSNDEYYRFRREELEALVRAGSSNKCFLYYTANSGILGRGYTRQGDRHNMESLKLWDTLPRLCDAAMSSECPELQLMRSWRSMLTEERLAAEDWLGYAPGVRRLWESTEQKGMDEQILFEVETGTEEYDNVAAIFRAQPAVPRAYADMNPGMWQHISILKIERVENGMQEDGSAEPYYKALQRGIENQGVSFVPGLHTRWAFHGSSAVESIVSNPISGFQPLMSGTRGNALWGSGTYFARDAKYVYDGGFCSTATDGSRQILLCLLMNGFVCLGDPEHKGVLPFRQGRHRYNTSVDSLSNPEIFVTQSPGAAYPAYVITFS